MALLPKVPWTDIDDARVAPDAPVSTDLMTDMVVNLNYLKSVLSDGAAAVADINANNLTLAGDGQVDGNFNVDGTFSTGSFFASDNLIFLFGS